MCNFTNYNVVCKIKSSIIGYCNYCNKVYCNKHRYPELHNCENFTLIKKDKLDILKTNLINSKIISTKITPI